MHELDEIAGKLGVPSVKIAIAKTQGFDMPDFLERYGMLEHPVNHVTLGRLRSGCGLAAACLGVLDFLGISNEQATVAIQGFGGLGGAAAYCLHRYGIRIVGLADEEKSLISNNGLRLDIAAMVENSADGLIPTGERIGQYADRNQIYDVECDVFIPAAVENAIVSDNAGAISVKAIVPGANLAITEGAERLLNDRGIIVIPDFMGGCGGSLSMDALFGPKSHPSVDDVLDEVERRMRSMVKKVLERGQKDGITPRQAAYNLCAEAPIYPNAKPYGPLDQ
jgi:glutamate dehydrogenase (NAD(P)+)